MIMKKRNRLKLIQEFENIRNSIKDKLTFKEINEEIAEVRSQKAEIKQRKNE